MKTVSLLSQNIDKKIIFLINIWLKNGFWMASDLKIIVRTYLVLVSLAWKGWILLKEAERGVFCIGVYSKLKIVDNKWWERSGKRNSGGGYDLRNGRNDLQPPTPSPLNCFETLIFPIYEQPNVVNLIYFKLWFVFYQIRLKY